MAKTKKKLAEKIFHKKSESDKRSVNPFEVHINKQKYQVLGQKSKHDHGLPGISRAKAIQKRKHTLLPEYNVKNKSNRFIDRRIGERNHTMTEEDRTMARFTAEKMRHHNRKSIYNLADDEILTHRGQTLQDLEKFDDPRSDDDDDNDFDEQGRKSSGKLNDSFVGDAHFGGGILTKTGKEGAKSHKDLIDQLIAESKKRKAEKQKTKEETLELTEKLDSEWKDLLPLVSKKKKDDDNEPEIKQKPDNYDKIMRELKFEARGNPTDRLKSEDEIAREEKERLEKLEEDRRNRMLGITENPVEKNKHRSADDLDDNFNFDSDPEDEILAYDEDGNLKNRIPEETETVDQIEEEHETEDTDSEHKSKKGKKSEDKNKGNKDSEEKEEDDNIEDDDKEDDEEEKGEESSDSEAETDDDLSDLKESEVDSDEEMQTNKIIIEKNDINEIESENIEAEFNTENIVDASLIKEEKDVEKELIIERAKKELPYTYSIPESYETFQSLLFSQLPEYQDIIIERMIKCSHPSLSAENKEHLNRLFVYLLQYLNDVSPDTIEEPNNIKFCFTILNILTPHLYNLAHLNPQGVRDSIVEVIKEKHFDYRKSLKQFPGLDVLVFLKLVGCLFSTSDFRHQIVTPAFVFISQMLTYCKVKTRYDVTYGLFLVTLFLEYTILSKRYLPAVATFLTGLVHMAVPKIGVRVIKIHPPFKSNSTALVLAEPFVSYQIDSKMISDDFVGTKFDAEFKIKTLSLTLKLCHELQENWKTYSCDINIFSQFYELLEKVPKKNYPKIVQDQIEDMIKYNATVRNDKKLNYIMIEKRRPKALRLYEPNIQPVFEYKRFKTTSREKAEQEKLLYRYKKEKKGALREIRRDKSFLGRMRIKQQVQSDYERREKVKRIYAEASIQQSELNSFDRKKKKK